MRRFIVAALCLLCLVGQLQGDTNPYVAGSVPVAGVSYLVNEGFEAGTIPSGWSAISGTMTYNYATALLGTYSMAGENVNWTRVRTNTFTGTSTIYTRFMFRANGTISSANQDWIFTLRPSGGAETGGLNLYNGNLTLNVGGSFRGWTAISAGTAYYVWVDVVVSGSDSVWNLYVNTTSSKPGSPSVTYTQTGVVTSFVDFLLRNELGSNNSITQIFDDVKAAAEAF